MFGLGSALVVVFVNSIVVTYFIGTSRWCKEVVETYSLDRGLLRRSVILKRRTFPWAVMAMLVGRWASSRWERRPIRARLAGHGELGHSPFDRRNRGLGVHLGPSSSKRSESMLIMK